MFLRQVPARSRWDYTWPTLSFGASQKPEEAGTGETLTGGSSGQESGEKPTAYIGQKALGP